MKILLILSILFTPFLLVAQQEDTLKLENIDVSTLSPSEFDALKKIINKSKENIPSSTQAEQWADTATAFSRALREGLLVFTEDIDKFLHTTTGKITIFVLAWKLMGSDVGELFWILLKIPLIFSLMIILNIMLKHYHSKFLGHTKQVESVDCKKIGWFTYSKKINYKDELIEGPYINNSDSAITFVVITAISNLILLVCLLFA